MSCKYNNCKHCGYKSECEIYKENTDLEKKLKHTEENCINKTCVVFKDKEDCVAQLLELEKEKAELKAQIERMKCCENCKHSDTECEGYTICGIGHYDDCLSNKVLYHTTDEKDYWELEEND